VAKDSLGLLGYDSFHFAVEKIDRSRDFYLNKLDFREIARASRGLAERSGQESTVVAAGDVRVAISHATRPTSKAARFLSRHPCGIMSLSFLVKDIDHAWKYLEKRNGTFLSEINTDERDGGSYRSFEIATPLAEVNYRFIERKNYPHFAPGFDSIAHDPRPNEFGISAIDHVTSNMRTMAPFLLWLEHVLGFEQYWEVSFHTEDVKAGGDHGSGLKSIVMWDPESGIRFANNEPLRPFFNESQIAKFVEDNAGAGVQHAALLLKDLVKSVEALRARGVEFLPAPGAYYDTMPERLRSTKITNMPVPIEVLRRNEILVDGRDDKYMLQIFMKEAANLYREPKAGPFFFELIQRGGHPGFGEGNFRALFESIEREQKSAG